MTGYTNGDRIGLGLEEKSVMVSVEEGNHLKDIRQIFGGREMCKKVESIL